MDWTVTVNSYLVKLRKFWQFDFGGLWDLTLLLSSHVCLWDFNQIAAVLGRKQEWHDEDVPFQLDSYTRADNCGNQQHNIPTRLFETTKGVNERGLHDF